MEPPAHLREAIAGEPVDAIVRNTQRLPGRTATLAIVVGVALAVLAPVAWLVANSGSDAVTIRVAGEEVDSSEGTPLVADLVILANGIGGIAIAAWGYTRKRAAGGWVALTPTRILETRGTRVIALNRTDIEGVTPWGRDATVVRSTLDRSLPGTGRSVVLIGPDAQALAETLRAPPRADAPAPVRLPENAAPWEATAATGAKARLDAAIGAEAPLFVAQTLVHGGLAVLAYRAIAVLLIGFPGLFILLIMAPSLFPAVTQSSSEGSDAGLVAILFCFVAAGALVWWNAGRMQALVGPWVAGVERGILVAEHDTVHVLPWERFSGRVTTRSLGNHGTVWIYKKKGPRAAGPRLGGRARIGIAGRVDTRVIAAAVQARLGKP